MSITLTEIITIEEYLSVFPQDASVEEEAIQSAINRATITLDGICGGMIAQVWPVTDPTSTLFRTETEKGYVKQAVALQAQYNVSRNLDFTAGSENYSSGSNNYNETRSRPDLVADETIYQLLAQARVYNPNITTDTTIANTANVGDFYNPSYDPQNDYITYAVGDLRYVLKHFPEGAGRTLGYNLDGNVEAFLTSVSPVANSYVVRNKYGTVKSTEPYDDDDCVTLQYFETHGGQHSGVWGGIQGDINDQLDLKEKLDEKISLLGNEQYSQGPYHFPYHFANLRYDENDFKLKGDLYTITLDNNKTLTNYPLEVQLPKIPTQYCEEMTMYGNNLDFVWNDGFTINYRPNFYTLDTQQTVTAQKNYRGNIVFDAWHTEGGTDPLYKWTDKLCFDRVYLYFKGPNTEAPIIATEGQLSLNCDYQDPIEGTTGTNRVYFPKVNSLSNGKTLALAEDISNTYLSQASAASTYATQTALQQGLATREVAGACYTKTESDNKYVVKATGNPVITAISGWTTWTNTMIPIGGNLYYLNLTVRNDTGSAQGANDLPVLTISGNAVDCALATACYEAPSVNIGCVIQSAYGYDTKVVKFRTGNGVIPAGAYIPISGIVQWNP